MSEVKKEYKKQEEWEELDEVPVALLSDNDNKLLPGVRTFMSTISGNEMTWYNELFALFVLFAFSGLFIVLFVLVLLGVFSKKARIIIFCMYLTLLIPAKLYDRKKMLWKIWEPLFQYFSFSTLWEDGYKDGNCLYAEFPHGVSPMGPLVSAFVIPKVTKQPIYCLTSMSALAVPIYRHILRWIGSVSSGYKNLLWALRNGSCAVVVGGIAEMYKVYHDREVLVLKSRKGFVRAAVETGVPIRPVYQFGTSQLLDLYPRSLEKIARKLQTACGIMVGRWYLPVPRKSQLMSVIGRDIPVKQMSRDDPHFNEYVDELHEQVIYEVQRLYHKYRKVFGYANRPLEII